MFYLYSQLQDYFTDCNDFSMENVRGRYYGLKDKKIENIPYKDSAGYFFDYTAIPHGR